MNDTDYRIEFDADKGYTIRGSEHGKDMLSIQVSGKTDASVIASAVELIRNISLCESKPIVMKQVVLTPHHIPTLILKPAEHAKPLASIFFLHGFATSKEKLIRYALRFAAAGYACIMPDLPRHGQRSDIPFGEEYNLRKNPGDALMKRLAIAKRCAQELPEIIQECLNDPDLDPERIALSGISMGGTVALLHAAENTHIKAAAPFVSVQNFSAMAAAGISEKENDLLPFDPVYAVKTMPRAAVLLQTGGADRDVPPECGQALDRVLRRLYEKSPDRYRFIEYAGAGHEVTPDMLDEAIRFFKDFL